MWNGQHADLRSEHHPRWARVRERRGDHGAAAAAVLSGVIGLALLLASESLEAGRLFDFTLRYPGHRRRFAHLAQYALVFLAVWWLLGALDRAAARRGRSAAALIALLLGLGRRAVPVVRGRPQFRRSTISAANVFGVLLRDRPRTRCCHPDETARSVVAVARDRRHCPRRTARIGACGTSTAACSTRAKAISQRPWTEYRLALHDGLDSPSFYNELAWIEVESGTGDVRAAVDYAARALAATPRDPDVLDTYGWALHHAGRSREALPLLERAFAGKPRMFCIHYHLGEVYAALGDRHARRVALSRTDSTSSPAAARRAGRSSRCGAAAWSSPERRVQRLTKRS